jgi:hypothetical protein
MPKMLAGAPFWEILSILLLALSIFPLNPSSPLRGTVRKRGEGSLHLGAVLDLVIFEWWSTVLWFASVLPSILELPTRVGLRSKIDLLQ